MKSHIEFHFSAKAQATLQRVTEARIRGDSWYPSYKAEYEAALRAFSRTCAAARLTTSGEEREELYRKALTRLDSDIVESFTFGNWGGEDERLEPGNADALRMARSANKLRSDREFKIAIAFHQQGRNPKATSPVSIGSAFL